MIKYLSINFIYELLKYIIMELNVLLPSTDREYLMGIVSKRDDQGRQMLSDIIGNWMLDENPLFGKFMILNYAKSANYVDFFIEALKNRMLNCGYYNNWDKFFELFDNLTELWQIRSLVSVLAAMPEIDWEQEYERRQEMFKGQVPKDKAENEHTRCLLLLKSLPATPKLKSALEERADESFLISQILAEKF